ncbi:MAG: hypothetical protein ABL890_02955 [Candidatus Peribacteraceae bacterium]
MKLPPRSFLPPALLFLGALYLDHTITQYGLQHALAAEGNPAAVLAWEFITPNVAVLLWAAVILGTAYVLYCFHHPRLALVLLYAGFAGHMIGFFTWTPIIGSLMWPLHEHLGDWWTLVIQYVGYVILGALLERLHRFVANGK